MGHGLTLTKKLPEELVVQAQPLGSLLKWVKIAGQGPNALDFHIAFYLGQILADRPKSECAILSRDTGFEPLMRYGRIVRSGSVA
jgi:PIN domain